jgi:hypothetical protein
LVNHIQWCREFVCAEVEGEGEGGVVGWMVVDCGRKTVRHRTWEAQFAAVGRSVYNARNPAAVNKKLQILVEKKNAFGNM